MGKTWKEWVNIIVDLLGRLLDALRGKPTQEVNEASKLDAEQEENNVSEEHTEIDSDASGVDVTPDGGIIYDDFNNGDRVPESKCGDSKG